MPVIVWMDEKRKRRAETMLRCSEHHKAYPLYGDKRVHEHDQVSQAGCTMCCRSLQLFFTMLYHGKPTPLLTSDKIRACPTAVVRNY